MCSNHRLWSQDSFFFFFFLTREQMAWHTNFEWMNEYKFERNAQSWIAWRGACSRKTLRKIILTFFSPVVKPPWCLIQPRVSFSIELWKSIVCKTQSLPVSLLHSFQQYRFQRLENMITEEKLILPVIWLQKGRLERN